jgi:HK97 gp10 family phage protein
LANFQHIKGLDAFQKALEQFPKAIAKNVLRGAVNAGATVLRQEAAYLAPVYEGDDKRVDPGLIKRAVYQKQIPEKSSELVQTFFVGVRRGKKSTVKVKGAKVTVDAYYWTWLEFGHFYVPKQPSGTTQKAHREVTKASPAAIWIQPKSFMRPAFAIAKGNAINAMVAYMEKRIPIEAQKLGLTMK